VLLGSFWKFWKFMPRGIPIERFAIHLSKNDLQILGLLPDLGFWQDLGLSTGDK